MKELRGFDWDGVLVNKDGTPHTGWCNNLRESVRAGHECVILTCNTDPEHVALAARVIFGKLAPVVHRFKRSDAAGKAQWLAANAKGRKAILIDDQWRHIEPCAALGVSTIHVGGLSKQS